MATKQKAVESLLQGVEDNRAWKDWYRLNACTKHGVQYKEAREVDLTEPQPQPQPQPKPRATAPPAAEPEQPNPLWGLAKTVLPLGLVAAAALAAAQFFNSTPTADPPPQEDPGVSLYQDIQDQGLHVTGG